MNKKTLLNLRGVVETTSIYVNNPNANADLKKIAAEVATTALKKLHEEIKKS